MDERKPWEWPEEAEEERPTSVEGVRIIGAEEAAEAAGREDVAQRRGDDLPRYGDPPPRPPDDGRAAVRFPLGADEEPDDLTRPRVSAGPSSAMPHWTEPATGEVPRIVADSDGSEDEDTAAWSSFSSGPGWRGEGTADWDEPDYDEASMTHDEETRIGALDTSDRPAPDDFFSFDTHDEPAPPPPFEEPGAEVPLVEPPRRAPRPRRSQVRERPRPAPRAAPTRPSTASPGRDLRTATVTGVAAAALALVAFALGSAAATVLVAAVVFLGAAELFAALQRGGYQPATLLGLVASVAAVLAAHWKGETALPLVLGLTVVFTLLWYLAGVTRAAPTVNLAVTVFGVVYVGVLGSFGALILTFPNGIGILIGVIVAVVADDVGSLVVGQRFGRSPVAPAISPNKTIEGLVGGALASVVVSVGALGVVGLHPWDIGSAAALGLLVAVVAPLGDLCESMMKRDLGIKDMGSVLPGHGGVLDRFDTMLFALPAAYYLCRLLEIF